MTGPTRTAPSRLLLLSAVAVVLGFAGGGAAYVLLHLIGLITSLALFHRAAWTVPSFRGVVFGPTLIMAAMAGGLMRVGAGHVVPGDPGARHPGGDGGHPDQAEPHPAADRDRQAPVGRHRHRDRRAVRRRGSDHRDRRRAGLADRPGASVSPAERKILLASGAAAGMAATFGAPLASVVLAIELLLFEFTTRAFIPLVVASSIAAGMHVALFGAGPLFSVPAHSFAGLDKLPLYAVLGVACGLLAVVIVRGLSLVERGYRRLPVREFWHPVIGALLFALIGLGVPRAMGVGYDAISDVLATKVALGALVVLGLGKLAAWWLALGSGTSGGTLAPILLIGGSFGGVLGSCSTGPSPASTSCPGPSPWSPWPPRSAPPPGPRSPRSCSCSS